MDVKGLDKQKRMSPISMDKSAGEPYVEDGEKMGVIEIEREKEKGDRQGRGVSFEKEKERLREVGRDRRRGSVAKQDLAGEDVDVEKEADAELGDNEDNSEVEDAEGEGEVKGEQHRGRSSLKEGNNWSKSALPKLSISKSRRPRVSLFAIPIPVTIPVTITILSSLAWTLVMAIFDRTPPSSPPLFHHYRPPQNKTTPSLQPPMASRAEPPRA